MTKSFISALLTFSGIVFLLLGCQNDTDDSTQTEIKEERDPRFAQCYYDEDLAKSKCDSVLTSFFGDDAFSLLKINSELSFIGCDEGDDLEMLAFGDDNCCLPRTYDLVYDIILKSDTIRQIPMVAGSEMRFEFISEEEKVKLLPYKALLRGDIEFDYADLISEMKHRNMNPERYEIELVEDLRMNLDNSIFWELSSVNDDDVVTTILVNARSGVFVPEKEIFMR